MEKTTPLRRRDTDSIRARRAEAVEAHRERLVARWEADIPDEYLGFSMSDIESGWQGHLTQGARALLKNYVYGQGSSRFLLLQGKAGVGKSTLAVTIATHMLREYGLIAEYHATPKLLQSFSFGFEDGSSLRSISQAPLLLLDDLGAGGGTMSDHQTKNMWALIDHRWSHKHLRTIITTNMAVSGNSSGIGVKEYLGETSWDRVSHDMTRVQMDGESLRQNIGDMTRFDLL